MSILLRSVHFVATDGQRRGKCRTAEVVDHGIETADLYIEMEPEDFAWSSDAEEILQHCRPRNVRYDETGKPGTFHFDDDCPTIKRERREADERVYRYIEHKRRLDRIIFRKKSTRWMIELQFCCKCWM